MINKHIRLKRMWRIIVIILAVIGSYYSCGMLIDHFTKSPFEYSLEEFGTKDSLIALTELYQQVLTEDNPNAPFEMYNGFPITKKVPADWIPKELANDEWSWGQLRTGTDSPWWGDVLAYYDESENLIGIEFYGSRRGCFITEDPKVCPSHAGTLHRLFSYPLYVSVREHYSHPRKNKPIQDVGIQEVIDVLNTWGSE